MAGFDARPRAQPVRPGAGGVDDPCALDALLRAAELVSQQHAYRTPMADIHREHLGVIACHRASFYSLDQPLRHQPLRELALCVLITEDRPASSRIQQSLQLVGIFAARTSLQFAAAQLAIQPESGAYGEGATAAVLVEREQKMNWVHQVRALLQQAAAFDQRLADQSELGMFQVAQAAVNDARGTAGGTGCEVVLFDQKRPSSGSSAFPRDGNAVDPAANDDYLEAFIVEWPPDWKGVVHVKPQLLRIIWRRFSDKEKDDQRAGGNMRSG